MTQSYFSIDSVRFALFTEVLQVISMGPFHTSYLKVQPVLRLDRDKVLAVLKERCGLAEEHMARLQLCHFTNLRTQIEQRQIRRAYVESMRSFLTVNAEALRVTMLSAAKFFEDFLSFSVDDDYDGALGEPLMRIFTMIARGELTEEQLKE